MLQRYNLLGIWRNPLDVQMQFSICFWRARGLWPLIPKSGVHGGCWTSFCPFQGGSPLCFLWKVFPHFHPSESKGKLFFTWMPRFTCTLGQIVGPLKSPFQCSLSCFNVYNFTFNHIFWSNVRFFELLTGIPKALNNCLHSPRLLKSRSLYLCKKVLAFSFCIIILLHCIVFCYYGSLGKVQ